MLMVVKRMCDVCGDIELVTWEQLSLDDTHEVEYRALRCRCRFVLLTVVMKETQGVV